MYSSALKMFEAAGMKEGLETGNNFTVIVPYNRAFKVCLHCADLLVKKCEMFTSQICL